MADAMFMAVRPDHFVQPHCCRSAKRIYGAFHPATLDRMLAKLLADVDVLVCRLLQRTHGIDRHHDLSVFQTCLCRVFAVSLGAPLFPRVKIFLSLHFLPASTLGNTSKIAKGHRDTFVSKSIAVFVTKIPKSNLSFQT